MPAALNVSSTTVAVDAGPVSWTNASVHVRGTRGRVVVRRETVLDRSDVVTVTRAGRRQPWVVTFSDGSTWTVTKVGCGCGS